MGNSANCACCDADQDKKATMDMMRNDKSPAPIGGATPAARGGVANDGLNLHDGGDNDPSLPPIDDVRGHKASDKKGWNGDDSHSNALTAMDNSLETRVEKLDDGSVFDGQFKGRDRHGWGKFTWATGGSYEGQFDTNNMHGEGTYIWTDGSKYEGQWQRNQLGPKGIMSWTDGRRYEGQFLDSKKHGEGTLHWPDGRSYSGQWEAGKQHGVGVTVTGKGVARRCQWDRGQLTRWLDERTETDTGGTPINGVAPKGLGGR